MPFLAPSPSHAREHGDSIGDLLAMVGVLHALGVDPRDFDPAGLPDLLPPGEHPILTWTAPADLRESDAALDDYPAGMLEEAAEHLGGRAQACRLELRDLPEWQQADWFVRTIGAARRVRPASVYLGIAEAAPVVRWDWPVRLRLAGGDAGAELGERLAAVLEGDGDGWRSKSLRLLPPGPAGANCTLVLAASVEEAAGMTSDRLRGATLLVLNTRREEVENASGVLRYLRADTGLAGLAFADVQAMDLAEDFFFAFLRALSHNMTFDRACVAACREFNVVYPVVLASTALARESRLGRFAGRLRRVLTKVPPPGDDRRAVPRIKSAPERPPSALAADEAAPELPPRKRGKRKAVKRKAAKRKAAKRKRTGGGAERGADAGDAPPDPVAPTPPDPVGATPPSDRPDPRARLGDLEWIERHDPLTEHEGDFSTDLSDLARDVEWEASAADVGPEPAGPRFLQARVTCGGEDCTRFLAGQLHQVFVRVGHQAEGWLQPGIAFPEEELPKEPLFHQLRVVLAVLGEEGTAREATILLPQGAGDSGVADFEVVVAEDATSFTARVMVLLGQRILQTGLLAGPVGEEGEGELRFSVETVVSRYFSFPEEVTDFGVGLFFNRNPDDRVGVSRITPGGCSVAAPDGLDEQLDRLNRIVSRIAHEPEEFDGTLQTNEKLKDYMVAFAREGAGLRKAIRGNVPAGSAFDDRKPVQVVTKTLGAKIPVEYFYDYEAPEKTAALCPGAMESLVTGACGEAHDHTVFCPSGFWGLNRILERHTYAPSDLSADFLLRNEPTAMRRVVSVRNRALLAGTQVVDKALTAGKGLAFLKERLDGITGDRSSLVDSWPRWVGAVNSEAPSMLTLVVHTRTGEEPFLDTEMEIGTDQWLGQLNIRAEHVGGSADGGPLVFLIGCETGIGDIRYQTLAEGFKQNGAAIVVSSDATINAVHAVPLLARMIELLQARLESEGSVYFGEIMQVMRREMLAEGIPIILCITAFGDADWIIN